jgi:hypothetical protein
VFDPHQSCEMESLYTPVTVNSCLRVPELLLPVAFCENDILNLKCWCLGAQTCSQANTKGCFILYLPSDSCKYIINCHSSGISLWRHAGC